MAIPSEEKMRNSLCDSFWKQPSESTIRIYALALGKLVHDVLRSQSSVFGLSDKDLENSDKLLQALQKEQKDHIADILKKGGMSPKLRRFVICVMKRLANIHARIDVPDRERLPWVGLYYSFLMRPDILDTGNFFPVDEMVFFKDIFKKGK